MAKPLIKDLMTPSPVVLHAGDTLEHALLEMERSGIRHLPVVDRGGHLMGLIGQRDLAALGNVLNARVGELMAAEVVTVAPETPACDGVFLLLHHAIGSLPVTDGAGHLVGIVTETDFLRAAYALFGGTAPLDDLDREDREAEAE